MGSMAVTAEKRATSDSRHRTTFIGWWYRKWNKVVAWVYILFFILFSALPIYWLVLTAFRDRDEILHLPVRLLPSSVSLINYQNIIQGVVNNDPITRYVLASVLVAFGGTIFALVLGVPCAYGLARFRVGGGFLPMWILSNRFFPPIVVVVPIFIIFKKLSMLDTYHGLIILYTAFNIPLVVWLMLSYFRNLPLEIEESAWLEGATYWQTFFRVSLPLARQGLAVAALFTYIFCWNEFIFAYQLGGSDVVPLPVYFPRLRSGHMFFFGELSAASLVSLLPALVFAWILQRSLVRGLTLGGVK
jgi:multiple sugar transport system permease protein